MFRKRPYEYKPSDPEFISFYTNRKPIGIYAFSYESTIKLMDVIFGINDRVVVQIDDGNFKIYKIQYNKSGSMFFNMHKRRYRLDHFVAVW